MWTLKIKVIWSITSFDMILDKIQWRHINQKIVFNKQRYPDAEQDCNDPIVSWIHRHLMK